MFVDAGNCSLHHLLIHERCIFSQSNQQYCGSEGEFFNSASQTSSIVAVKENFLIATFMVYFVF